MTLRITRLQAENYKRLVAVDISPDGNVVTIAGRNAQGKTSVLDAIWAALAGGEASRSTSRPIRDGEERATVTLDLGDYVVTRRWTKDDAGTLTVETPPNADGRSQKFSSPQALLDALIGKRAFDPLAFTRLGQREQVAALVATVELPFDPAELDAERKAAFDRRTEINREVKRLEVAQADMSEPAPGTPTEEVSAAALFTELQDIRAHNERREDIGRRGAEADRRFNETTVAIARLERELADAKAALAGLGREREALGAEYVALQPLNESDIQVRIASVDETNSAVRRARLHAEVARDVAAAKGRQAAANAEIKAIDERKEKALAEVTFPVAGLSFDDSGVTLNGIPLGQASAAEQLRVSAGLAMAANPELRILQVRDGSLLDSTSMQILAELAAEHDYQVWVELVDESGQVGIVIEDGQVAA